MGIFSIIKTLLLCAATLTILLANTSSGQHIGHLLSGERLDTGESLRTGDVYLTIQYDCSLVLHEFGTVFWSADTYGKGTDCYVAMQNDGNFVVYDSSNTALWESDTAGENGRYVIVLQRDRSLVIYSQPIWTTGKNSGGSVGVVVAASRDGTVGVSGVEQIKVRDMGKIVEDRSDE